MRNKRLDVLRCVAVLLVMIHHAHVSVFFTRSGWAGVDLFFVLSGFLISGLLFSEFKKHGSIRLKRFFIRRGLKIYPAFYAFLVLTAIVSSGAQHARSLDPTHFGLSSPARYLHEIFFLQNYCHGVWDHSWSLAVEEHFYIFVPIFLLVLVRLSSNRQDPFRAVPWAWVAIAAACIASRALSVYYGRPNFHMTYTATHERMDSLFFGVLLGYLHHFRPAVLQKLVQPWRNALIIAATSAILLSVAYLLPRENKFFATLGYSFVYLGFGSVLVLSLYGRGILARRPAWIASRIGRALAFVGMYSYSIYLWHAPCGAWLPGLVRRTLHFPTGEYGRFAVYFVGSLLVGITMSRLVEYPVLRLRDRFFPPAPVPHAPADARLAVPQALAPEVSPSI